MSLLTLFQNAGPPPVTGPAPTRHAVGTYVTIAGTGNLVLPIPANAVGDILLMSICGNSNATVTTQPSGWTLLSANSSGAYTAFVYYQVVNTVQSGSVSVPMNNASSGQIISYSGASTTILPTVVTTFSSYSASFSFPAQNYPSFAFIFVANTTSTTIASVTSSPGTWTATSPTNVSNFGIYDGPISGGTNSVLSGTLTGAGSGYSAIALSIPAAPVATSGTVSRVQFGQGNANYGTGITSFPVALPVAATAGNLIVAAWSVDKSAGTFTVPAGWTEVANIPGASVSTYVCYKIAQSGDTGVTLTWTTSALGCSANIVEYSGVDKVTPLGPDVIPVYNDTARTTLTFASSTTNTASLDLAFFAIDTTDTVALNPSSAGFTLVNSSYTGAFGAGAPGIAFLEKTTSANTTEAPTFTWTDSDQVTGVLLRLRVASTSSGNIKVFLSGSFVAKPVKIWNGSAWVVKPVKVWNGTTWVVTKY